MNQYLDIILRAVCVYLFMIIAIRIFGKKELAQLSVIDLVFILLISNAVQNAMVGPNVSLAGGLVAAISLFIVNFILKKLLLRYSGLNKFIQGEPILLVYKGIIKGDNIRKAGISMLELEAAIREHGVDGIENVDLAMLEVDGNISVLSDDFRKRSVKKRKRRKNEL